MQHSFLPAGLGIPTPERPDQDYGPHYHYQSDEPISVIREGNRAVPIQPMYADAFEEGEE